MPTIVVERLDPLSESERSKRMALVRNKHTKPELAVRRLIHSLGYRYRLHSRWLPGRPDIVFASRKRVVFVHGCFWHRHPNCPLARIPKSRVDFWKRKLNGNRRRDIANQKTLAEMDWDYLVIWECELGNEDRLRSRVQSFLGQTGL